jgi:hypothetical protein
MTMTIVISKEYFDVGQYRLREKSIFWPPFVISTARRNLSFVLVSTDSTTRSLTFVRDDRLGYHDDGKKLSVRTLLPTLSTGSMIERSNS